MTATEPAVVRINAAQAVAATGRGFEDVIRDLPRSSAHQRGERLVEGVFNTRARTEGNTVGYDTIAASGPHASHGSSVQSGFAQKLALDDFRILGQVRVERPQQHMHAVDDRFPGADPPRGERIQVRRIAIA